MIGPGRLFKYIFITVCKKDEAFSTFGRATAKESFASFEGRKDKKSVFVWKFTKENPLHWLYYRVKREDSSPTDPCNGQGSFAFTGYIGEDHAERYFVMKDLTVKWTSDLNKLRLEGSYYQIARTWNSCDGGKNFIPTPYTLSYK